MYVHKMDQSRYCPTEYGVNLFGGKWKPRILCLLYIKDTLRYKEIKQYTPGISDNVLASTLKELIAAQLINREQFEEMPLRVEYSLTDKGKELIPVLHTICKWTVSSYGESVIMSAETCPFKALMESKHKGL